jgi:hypothetical protein
VRLVTYMAHWTCVQSAPCESSPSGQGGDIHRSTAAPTSYAGSANRGQVREVRAPAAARNDQPLEGVRYRNCLCDNKRNAPPRGTVDRDRSCAISGLAARSIVLDRARFPAESDRVRSGLPLFKPAVRRRPGDADRMRLVYGMRRGLPGGDRRVVSAVGALVAVGPGRRRRSPRRARASATQAYASREQLDQDTMVVAADHEGWAEPPRVVLVEVPPRLRALHGCAAPVTKAERQGR